MEKNQHSHNSLKGSNLGIAILLNLFITLSQVIGGFISGSLALLSDAMHNFSDVLALIISWIANRLSARQITPRQTFGYKRAEILAALINATTLIVIAFFLVKEAIERFYNPEPILSGWVMGLGVLSIILNGISVLLVQKDAHNNINMRTAYLHLFTDMISSVAVVAGGVAMNLWDLLWVDGVISIVVAIYLVVSSWGLIMQSIRILMQFAPPNIDLDEINRRILFIEGVKNMHHVHVWQLNDQQVNFEAHISFENDQMLGTVNVTLEKIENILHEEFNIRHVTLQPEIDSNCRQDNLVG